VVLVRGVPVIEGTWFELAAIEAVGVGPSRSSKPQASSAVSLTGDTINELEPLDVWRIGSRLVEEAIEFSEPNESIWVVIDGGSLCRVPFVLGGSGLEDKKSENSSSSNKLVLEVSCDGGNEVGMDVVIGGVPVLVEGWGVAGLRGDAGGGGIRKGTAPEDDVEDIRTMGNDGVWGRSGFAGPLVASICDVVLGGRKVPLCEVTEEGREGV
jgi:hypothetical protein